MREQTDKKGGGISLIKEKGGCTWVKIESECSDIVMDFSALMTKNQLLKEITI